MAITDDRYYRSEIVPASILDLGRKLCTHFGVPANHFGSKGNPDTHRRGYHRSANFVLHSPYCIDRRYSVEAAVNQSGNRDWISAFDLSLSTAQLIAVCKRLDMAARTGVVEKIVEWYGTIDGKRVTGYDNILNVTATSDSSHLWHLHVSFARSRAADNHDDVYRILTGDIDMKLDPITIAADFARLTGNYPAEAGVEYDSERYIQHIFYRAWQAEKAGLSARDAALEAVSILRAHGNGEFESEDRNKLGRVEALVVQHLLSAAISAAGAEDQVTRLRDEVAELKTLIQNLPASNAATGAEIAAALIEQVSTPPTVKATTKGVKS